MLGGIATAAAVAAGVFASLWLSERQDHDGTRAELDGHADLDDLAAAPTGSGDRRTWSRSTLVSTAGWWSRRSPTPTRSTPATPAGVVLRQLPEPGTPLPDGAVVVVVVTEP